MQGTVTRLMLPAAALAPIGAVLASASIDLAPNQRVDLTVSAEGGRYSFRSSVAPRVWRTLADTVDSSILSPHVAGGFVGTTFGLYAGRLPEPAPGR